MLVPIAVTLLALAALLASEYLERHEGVWVAKPLASTGFIALALQAGALDAGRYGVFVLVALGLSWLGDVLLIPRGKPQIFRLGILAFLLGHIAFVVAFAVRGLDPLAAGLGAVPLAGIGVLVLRWLRPHVPPDFVAAVHAYVVVIAFMVVCAIGTVAAHGRPLILLGAVMFFVSDISVARDRFVAPGFQNTVWGLPLYYGGQLLLAASVAGA